MQLIMCVSGKKAPVRQAVTGRLSYFEAKHRVGREVL